MFVILLKYIHIQYNPSMPENGVILDTILLCAGPAVIWAASISGNVKPHQREIITETEMVLGNTE